MRCHLYSPNISKSRNTSAAQNNEKGFSAVVKFEEPSKNQQPLLEIDHLHVRFLIMNRIQAMLRSTENRYVDAVLDASLSVNQGETVGLVGESGSGKTSLGLAVLGLNKIYRGSIKFQGDELVGLSQREYRSKRRHISMMVPRSSRFIEPASNDRTTVG